MLPGVIKRPRELTSSQEMPGIKDLTATRTLEPNIQTVKNKDEAMYFPKVSDKDPYINSVQDTKDEPFINGVSSNVPLSHSKISSAPRRMNAKDLIDKDNVYMINDLDIMVKRGIVEVHDNEDNSRTGTT